MPRRTRRTRGVPMIAAGLAIAASLAAVGAPTDQARARSGTGEAVAGFDVVPRGGEADDDLSGSPNVAPVEGDGNGDGTSAPDGEGQLDGVEDLDETTDDTAETPAPVPEPIGGDVPGADWAAFDRAVLDRLGSANAAVAVAIRKDGILVHEGARGTANRLTGAPATPDSKFRIASNSKTITAIVALQLVGEGRLALDEPILQPLADAYGVRLGDDRMSRVTLRHLLGHRSGFADFDAQFFRNATVSCEGAAMQAMQARLRSTPGGSSNYSNMNYCLLSLIMEQAGGDGYDVLVQTKLLEPLGITGMRLVGNGDVRDGDVQHAEGVGRNFMEVLEGAGSWIASPKDMTKILDSLDPNRPGWHPLPAELATQMYAPTGGGLGLGMRLWGSTWGHTGTIQAAHSIMVHRPDGFTIAITISGETPFETDDLLGYISRGLNAAGVA